MSAVVARILINSTYTFYVNVYDIFSPFWLWTTTKKIDIKIYAKTYLFFLSLFRLFADGDNMPAIIRNSSTTTPNGTLWKYNKIF